MYAENLDYLSRTSPSSPLMYKKSPPKYIFNEPKYVEPYTLNKSLSHLSYLGGLFLYMRGELGDVLDR